MSGAYKVIVDKKPCPHCGEGMLWTVEGPDGICIGQSFMDFVDAEETAGTLNGAYELGLKALRREAINPHWNNEMVGRVV